MTHTINAIEFKVFGKYALFTDPITKLGGEKCSYHVPTYEAIKGILKSIYWKPTFIWKVDKVRIIKPIRTEAKGVKPLRWTGGNDLAYYTYLHDVEYQVQAHFEWNMAQVNLVNDRNSGKHHAMALRSLKRGGRQDIFLGSRECQGYVEPCEWGSESGFYDGIDELGFGTMFYSFDYPDENSNINEKNKWFKKLCHVKMKKGILEFSNFKRTEIRTMIPKNWEIDTNILSIEKEKE